MEWASWLPPWALSLPSWCWPSQSLPSEPPEQWEGRLFLSTTERFFLPLSVASQSPFSVISVHCLLSVSVCPFSSLPPPVIPLHCFHQSRLLKPRLTLSNLKGKRCLCWTVSIPPDRDGAPHLCDTFCVELVGRTQMISMNEFLPWDELLRSQFPHWFSRIP